MPTLRALRLGVGAVFCAALTVVLGGYCLPAVASTGSAVSATSVPLNAKNPATFTLKSGTAKAQNPIDLGTAGTFAILAGSTVTNTGPSIVTGDLGLSPGAAVVGFPPGILNGAMFTGVGSAAGQAKLDLAAAFADAAGRSTDAISLPGDLSGLVLYPGLYTNATSVMLSAGTVTLDARGDVGALFVFQMGTTLTTGSSTQVLLSGGAQAANIYWQVGSSATLGTSSIFKGNILAQESITLTTRATMEGRALTQAAAVTLDNAVITVPVAQSPSIGLVKTADQDQYTAAGDILTYTFTVANTGNVALTNVTLTDPSATVAGGPIASLAPGATDSATFTASHAVTEADVDAGYFDNTASAAGAPPTGPAVTATDTATVTAVQPPSLMLTTHSPLTVTAPFTIMATFSRAVTGFDGNDVVVDNGTLSGFAGVDDSYSWTVTPTAAGWVRVSVAAGVCVDAAGNANTAAADLEEDYVVPTPGTDSDGDSVRDNLDDFPNDVTRAFINVYPSTNKWATIAFEDYWPVRGDYDLNDLVLRYQVATVTDYAGRVKDIDITAKIQARGAQNKSGFGIELPLIAPNSVWTTADANPPPKDLPASITLTDVRHYPLPKTTTYSVSPETGQEHLTWVLFDDASVYDPWNSTDTYLNTDPKLSKKSCATFALKMTFKDPQLQSAVGLPLYNPFIFPTGNRVQEVHLLNYPPTSKAVGLGIAAKYFGTGDDDSSLADHRYYVTNAKTGASGLPWAMSFADPWNHPQERRDISSVYPVIITWANSGGLDGLDWYMRPNTLQRLYYNYQHITYLTK